MTGKTSGAPNSLYAFSGPETGTGLVFLLVIYLLQPPGSRVPSFCRALPGRTIPPPKHPAPRLAPFPLTPMPQAKKGSPFLMDVSKYIEVYKSFPGLWPKIMRYNTNAPLPVSPPQHTQPPPIPRFIKSKHDLNFLLDTPWPAATALRYPATPILPYSLRPVFSAFSLSAFASSRLKKHPAPRHK